MSTKEKLLLLRDTLDAAISAESLMIEMTPAEREIYAIKYGKYDFIVGGFGITILKE